MRDFLHRAFQVRAFLLDPSHDLTPFHSMDITKTSSFVLITINLLFKVLFLLKKKVAEYDFFMVIIAKTSNIKQEKCVSF